VLEKLVEYASAHGIECEPGFKTKDVRWAISCDKHGTFLEVVELGATSEKRNPGRTFPKCPDLSQSELISGGITRSHFLAESAEVVAFHAASPIDAKLVLKHLYFIESLDSAAEMMPSLAPIARMLQTGASLEVLRERLQECKAKPTDKITFMIGDAFPLESDEWHEWWRGRRESLRPRDSRSANDPLMRCLATGSLVRPTATHPKIERLFDVGGLPTGDVLIGFDKEAFCSYGLKQSANAPVSEESAAAYRAALNALIKEHSQRLAGIKVVHWFGRNVGAEDDPFLWLGQGVEKQVLRAESMAAKLLTGLKTGNPADVADNCFHALTLSGASGRVMVLDWMEGQFEELAANVAQWLRDLSIVRRDGRGLAPYPKFLAVMGATVRDLSDLSAPLVAATWRAAVCGAPLPAAVLAQALWRTRVDVINDLPPNHARYGLLKAYQLRKARNGRRGITSESLQPWLNEDHPDPAYQCGRLAGTMAELQRAALGDAGAGLVQRSYATASTMPALIIDRLVRASQSHLGRLEGGLARWYESQLAGVWGHLRTGLPRVLDIEGQSFFALGYYQQIAFARTREQTTALEASDE
jgi:CRISPR-associated protein Csd1